ncbi:MAG: hypothetical protein WBP81_25270, partial [Solirubrobacteraceae bacterium]
MPPPASREPSRRNHQALAGGLSRVHERAKPANPQTTTNGAITPTRDQTQRRSTAVQAVTDCRWVLLYVKRWLAAPLQYPDGILVERGKGTPQGSA